MSVEASSCHGNVLEDVDEEDIEALVDPSMRPILRKVYKEVAKGFLKCNQEMVAANRKLECNNAALERENFLNAERFDELELRLKKSEDERKMMERNNQVQHNKILILERDLAKVSKQLQQVLTLSNTCHSSIESVIRK